ncbi:hypothetical protein [Amaricoccus macauensis]|uniref:hypothetical protein n=1 Tax=Amaricoccus macauensis TaxID=57001 RepID=UPI003C7ADB12
MKLVAGFLSPTGSKVFAAFLLLFACSPVARSDTYVSNTFSPILRSGDGAYYENDLVLVSNGTALDRWNYSASLGLASRRQQNDQDTITATLAVSRRAGSYQFGVNQFMFARYRPSLFNFARVAFPTRAFVQKTFILKDRSILVADFSVGRRNTVDQPNLERSDLRPSFVYFRPVGSGVVLLGGNLSYQVYDKKGRVDLAGRFDASYYVPVTDHATIGFNVGLQGADSNLKKHDYKRLEIGPYFTVTF